MKNWFILFSCFCIACGNNTTKENTTFQLEVGDILFQDLDSSPLCDAIELVTPGYNGANFSHIGLIVSDNDTLKVLESIPPKVILTKLDDFLNRSSDQNGEPKVIVGRLNDEYKNTIPKAIQFAKKQIGVDYDEVFILDNDKYYCSELIYEAFSKDSIFQLQPMTFLHPETKDTLETWKEYYSDLGVEIPQNKLGINPGIMSLSEKIEIIHFYGIPDGIKK
ncbi:MAG: YiiX/YebB-like N1pC/P60 family cysteine hydrolase [Flavobacteriales bacterium]|jgi:hypothetical protein|nr:YiiX/YebB-like N1pC/P60 family cysteine hydrolase [Flavobacteriales bacterium]